MFGKWPFSSSAFFAGYLYIDHWFGSWKLQHLGVVWLVFYGCLVDADDTVLCIRCSSCYTHVTLRLLILIFSQTLQSHCKVRSLSWFTTVACQQLLADSCRFIIARMDNCSRRTVAPGYELARTNALQIPVVAWLPKITHKDSNSSNSCPVPCNVNISIMNRKLHVLYNI